MVLSDWSSEGAGPAILIEPQNTEENGGLCQLPGGEEVNFYQVIPLYREEMEYKLEHDADTLLEKMAEVDFVVDPARPNCINRTYRTEKKS